MYPDFDQLPISRMSNSQPFVAKNVEFETDVFNIKKDQDECLVHVASQDQQIHSELETAEFNSKKRPTLEIQDEDLHFHDHQAEFHTGVVSREFEGQDHNQAQKEDKKEEGKDNIILPKEEITKSSLELGQLEAIMNEEEEINDGFKTPTSLKHKIPVITECPPAPRILRSKRKLSPSLHRNLRFDLSKEIEQALFHQSLLENISKKIKKVQKDDKD